MGTIFREMERLQASLLGKANVEELQRCLQSMCDKSWVKAQISGIPSKSDLDAALKAKVEVAELARNLAKLESDWQQSLSD